jgi:hypothetical protein
MKHPKYPAYGKQLAERIKWKNQPKLVIINVGGNNAWERAKNWQQYPDFASLVLTPDTEPKRLIWPVSGLLCFIEWDAAVPESLVIDLVKALKSACPLDVIVMPMWVNHDSPAYCYDFKTQSFVQERECMKTYSPRKEKKNAA